MKTTRKRSSFFGKAARIGLSAVLASTLALPVAYAAPDEGQLTSGVLAAQSTSLTWTAPSESMEVDSSIISTGSHYSASASAEMLGLNGTVLSQNQVAATTDASKATTSNRLGVYGSSANVNPNPYLWNSFYNYATASADAQSENAAAVYTYGTSSFKFNHELESAAGYDVPADLIWRPDIVQGISYAVGASFRDITLNHDTTSSRYYSSWGTGLTIPTQSYQYVLDIRRRTNDPALQGEKNSDGNAYRTDEQFREGDNDFDPVGVVYDTGENVSGLDLMVDNANELAWAAERIMQDNPAKAARYGNPLEVANTYEKFVRGIKWAVLSKIADGTVNKKTVAVVARVVAPNADGAYTFQLVKLNPDGDDGLTGTLRVAEATQDTVNDLAETYYPAKKPGLQSGMYVTAQQLMEADAVICLPPLIASYDSSAESVRAALTASGYEDASAQPAIFDNVIPTGTFESIEGISDSVEAGMFVGLIQGFLYPEVINAVDATTFYASRLFHLNDSYIEAFVKSQLEGITLADGVSLDTASYDAATVAAVQDTLDKGTTYYYANKAAIDAARPRIASSDALDDAYGVDVSNVRISVPTGATLSVVDAHNLTVEPNTDGTYALDNTSGTTITVSLGGYRDFIATITGAQGDVAITTNDMVATKTVTFAIPAKATVKNVLDSNLRIVKANADGTYTLDAANSAKYTISMDGYDDYEGTIAAGTGDVTITLKVSDFSLESTATTIDIPIGASLVVTGADGAKVKQQSDGTYRLTNGATYTLKVTHPSYEPYTTKVVGGKSAKVYVRLASMKPRAGKKALTINKAKVTADDIASVDTTTVTNVTLGAKVKTINKGAFKDCKKLTTLTVKTKKLTKKSVKNSLTGSTVKTIKVNVGNAQANKKLVAKYKKIFTKANCGKAVTVE